MTYLKRFITKRKIWFKSQLIPERSLILVYHRLGKAVKDSDPYSLTVSPENFSEHLKILKKYFDVISLSELLLRIKNKKLTRKSIVVTFDDGYVDNMILAEPLLEQFKVTASFFLTTGYLGKIFWWDLLAGIIFNRKMDRRIILKNKEFIFGTKLKERLKCLDEIILYFGSLSYNEKLEFISELNSFNNKSITGNFTRCMTGDEIAGISKSRFIEIGGHTLQHFPLSTLNYNEQCNEILFNKSGLENLIQKEVNLFAYPHGNYNSDSIKILKKNSFMCGLTGPMGVVHNNSDPYQLNRLSVLNWNKRTFQFILKYWI